jgi:hypothetical protein
MRERRGANPGNGRYKITLIVVDDITPRHFAVGRGESLCLVIRFEGYSF